MNRITEAARVDQYWHRVLVVYFIAPPSVFMSLLGTEALFFNPRTVSCSLRTNTRDSSLSGSLRPISKTVYSLLQPSAQQ